MGIINRLLRVCVFCGEKHNIKYVPAYNMYKMTSSGHWFHEACVQNILCYPESHSNKIIDLAIDIIERDKFERAKKKNHCRRTMTACKVAQKLYKEKK